MLKVWPAGRELSTWPLVLTAPTYQVKLCPGVRASAVVVVNEVTVPTFGMLMAAAWAVLSTTYK